MKRNYTDFLHDILVSWDKFFQSVRSSRTVQSFCVPKVDIAFQGYDLNLNRYKEVVHEEVEQ
ncbi:hypothetical protein [Nodularia sp. UHCC 0506]|uniref:hypothetical protein n=1 Tax=Nodularia sp. UHCC 0506 TaxID=3110243 RepID=UPI002B1E941D|nr:hypothetical protein [Nodularia sp. UHCC 0506]MEA5517221.1 hypothetical protein [Nodularia sp. UHCC 0506]